MKPGRRLTVIGLLTLAVAATAFGQRDCSSLTSAKVPHAIVSKAESVAAGSFVPPAGIMDTLGAKAYKNVPAFCRVVIDDRPTADSHIGIEVWLPMAEWNGKLQGTGNGGFAGEISFGMMASSVSAGYAVAGTDTGHVGTSQDATWALGHPEKVKDYGYRAIHEMTEVAKMLIAEFYGKPSSRAYFAGCSDGGREGLMEAQRYPADYDGIVAGAPANYFTRQFSGFITNAQALAADGANISPAKLPAISAAVLAACDAEDGLADGLLDDPRTCKFKPEDMLCQGPETDRCLTAPQVHALNAIYGGVVNAKGEQLFPGYMKGGELGNLGWRMWQFANAGENTHQKALGAPFFEYMVFDDPKWDFRTFQVDRDLARTEEKTAGVLNAISPDLSAFKARGGKLILYHGWSDPIAPPLNTVNYYESVRRRFGSSADSFVTLYMVPGMSHCFGGPGPNLFGQFGAAPHQKDAQHDLFTSTEDWVEKGTPPSQIVAEKHQSEFDFAGLTPLTKSRPLCPYPQLAKYRGTGDINDAANYSCKAPEEKRRK